MCKVGEGVRGLGGTERHKLRLFLHLLLGPLINHVFMCACQANSNQATVGDSPTTL